MRNNWVKYIFFVFVVGILIFAVYKINKDENTEKNMVNVGGQTQEQNINREIHLGIVNFDNLNPIISKNKNVQDVSRLIFDPLVNITHDYKAEPCLATQWAKAEGNTYIIKLREDVKWSNGEKFTAEDVKFTVDRLKEIESIYSYNVQYVIELDIVDSQTIKIKLDREIPFFEYYLTFPIISSNYYKDQDFVGTDKNIKPLGTGIYQVAEKTDTTITLTKNPNWWQKKGTTLEKISINLYSSAGELYNSFKMGNIDLINTSNANLQDYIGTIGYNAKEIKGRQYDFIAFNTQKEALAKIEVRKAIAYSIDKNNIISSIYNNQYYTSDFPLDYGSYLYTKEGNSEYNLDYAKQLLVEQGWSYKNKYWQKYENRKTQRLSFNLVVKNTDERRVAVAESIKAQLENQGIRINLIRASESSYNSYLENKNYDIILCSIYSSLSPSLETYFGQNNLAQYENPEVTNILQEVKNTNNQNILVEKYKRLSEIYGMDVPYISLYMDKEIIAYNTGLVGDMTPNWYNIFYNIEGWYK